jgi:hypothetical protein
MPRDLLGAPLRERRPRYEASLERQDRASLATRAERVRWLAKIVPRNIMMGVPLETMIVFQEAKSTFVAGQHVATIVLAAAFIEHWFASTPVQDGLSLEVR